MSSAVVSKERVLWHKRSRFNPIRQLSPETLARQLDAFEYGDLKEAALLWDVLERRDDTLMCVAAKRKAAPARLPWEILTMDDSPEAERQKEVLEDFYNNLRVTDAMDRNRRGGVSLLIRQMMDAVGKRYAVHNIVWQPGAAGMRAELQFVPLWFFENRSGVLRYLESENALEGIDLKPGAWLTTVGQGLMETSSIAATFKRLPFQDWLTYCERHGMPGIHGKTNASQGSDEWSNMEEAIAAFAQEWAILTDLNAVIEKLDMSANGELPYPKLVERMDRAISALWRGADLSTMSAGSGDGSGASLQGNEADLIEDDDAQMISDTLNEQLDRWVLRLALGVEQPLAYFSITRPQEADSSRELAIDAFLLQNGAPLGLADTLERYGRPMPEDGEKLIQAPATPAAADPVAESRRAYAQLRAAHLGANEQPTPDDLIAAAVAGLQEAHKDLAGRLQAFLVDDNAGEEELEQLLDDLEALGDDDEAAADAWEKLITAASFEGLTSQEVDA